MRKRRTSISVSPKTRELLESFGKKGETYDSIIRRLIKFSSEQK